MANFQRIVLMIAGALFIVSLCLIAYATRKSHNNIVWPPVVGECPDYWIDLSGNGDQCSNVMNLGTCNIKTMNFDVAPYVGAGGTCAKYNWAVGCGVTWDGITSGVSNPCDISGNSQ
jgi:hypothetical protein